MKDDKDAPRAYRTEKLIIRVLMGIHGVSMVFALPAVIMPASWMAAATEWVAPGTEVTPLFSYLARSLSGFYFLLGVLLLLFITDIERYRRGLVVVSLWTYFFNTFLVFTGISGLGTFEKPWMPLFALGDGLWGLGAATAVLVCLHRMSALVAGDESADAPAA